MRASPAAVRGPVELPPCIRQRPFGMAGDRQAVPARVVAPHRGQDCASGSVVRQSGRRCMGFLRGLALMPHPLPMLRPAGRVSLDVADDGLPALRNHDTLHPHHLPHALASLAVQGRQHVQKRTR